MPAFPDTPAGRWLDTFVQCYSERRVAALKAFVKTWIPPQARIGESDLTPLPIPDPSQPDWLLELLYQHRGLSVVAIDQTSPTLLAATLLERFPTFHGTVRLELRVTGSGHLEFFRIASIPHAASASRRPPRVLVKTFNDERIRQVDAAIRELVKHDLFSGVALIAYDGVPLYMGAFGEAQLGLRHRVSPQTRFNLASITKSFTATAVLSLVQQGKLGLHESVVHHLPDAPRSWSEVTAHQLLTHTAGFGPAVLTDDLHWLWKDRCLDMKVWWQLVRERVPLEAPGAKTLYSNVGYVILGELISRVSSRDYFDVVHDTVFRPAGMYDTAFDVLDFEQERRATGYLLALDADGARQRPHRSHLREVEVRGGPHGFAYSTVRDLLHFVRAIRQRALLDEHHTRLLWGLSNGLHDGYGFFCAQTHAGPVIHVSGAGPGISAWLDLHPDEDFVVAVLANYGAPAAHRVGRRIRQLLLEQARESSLRRRP